MFTSLKNKIREETGNDVCAAHPVFTSHRRNSLSLNNFNNNSIIDTNQNGVSQQRISAIISPIDQLNAIISQKNEEISVLIEKLNESEANFTTLSAENGELKTANDRLGKSNYVLEDAVRCAQKQKELINSEQDKIQNLQAQEISKLKSLLHFREQVNILILCWIFFFVIHNFIPFIYRKRLIG